uniref:Iodothyronine deiodinase n=4 Tax=Callorhinchus milii TaxID=7868 RepID=A0A4W3ID65_CALMI
MWRRVVVYMQTVLLLVCICVRVAVGRVMLTLFPATTRRLELRNGLKTTMTLNPRFRFEDWGPSMFSLSSLRAVTTSIIANSGDRAFPGQPAPDTTLIDLDNTAHTIRSFIRGSRPLVLSFGSCT